MSTSYHSCKAVTRLCLTQNYNHPICDYSWQTVASIHWIPTDLFVIAVCHCVSKLTLWVCKKKQKNPKKHWNSSLLMDNMSLSFEYLYMYYMSLPLHQGKYNLEYRKHIIGTNWSLKISQGESCEASWHQIQPLTFNCTWRSFKHFGEPIIFFIIKIYRSPRNLKRKTTNEAR